MVDRCWFDLLAHREEWTAERLGDHWLGFSVDAEMGPVTRGAGNEPFSVVAAVGTKSRARFRHLRERARE